MTKQHRQKRGTIYLLIGIPLVSVLMGVFTLYVAFNTSDGEVRRPSEVPMSKTSWQERNDDR